MKRPQKVSVRPKMHTPIRAQQIKNKRHIANSESDESQEDHSAGDSNAAEDSEDEEETNESASSDEEEPDADQPRILQWEAEGDDAEIDSEDDRGEGSSKLPQVPAKGEISSLSFGSLLKARRVLDQAQAESDSNTSDNAQSEDEPEQATTKSQDGGWNIKDMANIKKAEKRAHKHAPIEMTSKRPVTRRRQVVEVKKVNYRDPRFLPLAGGEVPGAFHKSYSFLADMHKTELNTLKDNLKRARNMLRSSPRDQQEARQEEVERLERAMKRAESSVNRNRREEVERQALEKAHKEEKERRQGGKGEWHMKNSAKKDMLLKARHDALAETGGRFAVRKAIEKRQKKVNQKEKRKIPSFMGRVGRADSGDGSSSGKRRRIST